VHESGVLGAVYLDRRNREKPFDENDLSFLLSFARQIVRGILTSGEFSSLREMLVSDASMQFGDLRAQFSCPDIIGSGRRLFEVLRIAHKIAPTDAPVILLGENGTGKDLLAHAIHANSRRSAGPFVTINCGAIPADLLESELFGYEPGAFTGAVKAKPGKLEMADGGTIFFDEIAELSLNLQAKLLRVLQKRDIERLGSVRATRIDVRFIAATNRAVAEMVEEGTFREDLYYRLKVIELTMPPLRERREDIADLASFFSAKYSPKGNPVPVSPDAVDVLERYHWPGNIRELENVIHRSIVLGRDTAIGKDDLPPEIVEGLDSVPGVAPGLGLAAAEEEFRRLYIIKTLRDSGSVAEAAKALGINRTHFYRLLSQLGIEY
jgi:Nif-specific regulatory protein